MHLLRLDLESPPRQSFGDDGAHITRKINRVWLAGGWARSQARPVAM